MNALDPNNPKAGTRCRPARRRRATRLRQRTKLLKCRRKIRRMSWGRSRQSECRTRSRQQSAMRFEVPRQHRRECPALRVRVDRAVHPEPPIPCRPSARRPNDLPSILPGSSWHSRRATVPGCRAPVARSQPAARNRGKCRRDSRKGRDAPSMGEDRAAPPREAGGKPDADPGPFPQPAERRSLAPGLSHDG